MTDALTHSQHGGIPAAPFVENVQDFVTDLEDVDKVLQQFQEAIAKYKFMQDSLNKTSLSLEEKIPEIQKTLDSVDFLLEMRNSGTTSAITHFELNDTLYAQAEIPATDVVNIWLGANTMVEYPICDAQSMLTTRLATALDSRKLTRNNLEYLREQITTMEVNLARIYNWGVEKRRTMRE